LRGERIGQGRERAVEWLRERPQLVEELAAQVGPPSSPPPQAEPPPACEEAAA